jgi:F0F1-type ATP synthase assembly protein I
MTADREKPELGGLELLSMGAFNGLCVAAGFGIGWFADHMIGSSPVGTIIGLLAGLCAGIVGTWVQLKKYIKADRSS